MTDRAWLLQIATAYKEQIYTKLLELIPERMASLDRSVFEGKTTEEVLTLTYMQGVGEALDAFDVNELLREVALKSGNAETEGLEA